MCQNIIEFINLIKEKKYALSLEYLATNKITRDHFNILMQEFNEDNIQYENFIDFGFKKKIINEKKTFSLVIMLIVNLNLKKKLDLVKYYLIKALRYRLNSYLKKFDLKINISDSYPLGLVCIEKKNYLLDISVSNKLVGSVLSKEYHYIQNPTTFAYIFLPVLISSQINTSYCKIFYELSDYATLENTASFSSNKKSSILIPDPRFINSNGYKNIFTKIKKINFKYINAYWKGTINSNQRCYLMEYSKNKEFLICETHKVKREYFHKNFFVHKPSKIENFFDYLIQIDVDGNSNAWNGCFIKLASGFPTMKIKSEKNFSQWWYKDMHRLDNIYWVDKDLRNFSEVYQNILFQWENKFIEKRQENFLSNMILENEIKFASDRVLQISNKFTF